MVGQAEVQKDKLTKCEEKRRRKRDNIMFQRDQKRFFRMPEGEETHEGDMPEMESLSSFGGVFGKEKKESQTCHGWKR